mgnify:CR=1 FL=1
MVWMDSKFVVSSSSNVNTNDAKYDPKDTYPSTIGVDNDGYLTGITSETTTGLGVYRVSLRSDNSVVLRALSVDQASQVTSETRLIEVVAVNHHRGHGVAVGGLCGAGHKQLLDRLVAAVGVHILWATTMTCTSTKKATTTSLAAPTAVQTAWSTSCTTCTTRTAI